MTIKNMVNANKIAAERDNAQRVAGGLLIGLGATLIAAAVGAVKHRKTVQVLNERLEAVEAALTPSTNTLVEVPDLTNQDCFTEVAAEVFNTIAPSEDIKEETKEIVGDIVEDITDKIEDIKEKAEDIKEKAEDIKEKAEDIKEETADAVGDIVEDIADKAEDIKEDIKDASEGVFHKVQNIIDVSVDTKPLEEAEKKVASNNNKKKGGKK